MSQIIDTCCESVNIRASKFFVISFLMRANSFNGVFFFDFL